jgi:hypothetical protein
MATRVCTKQEIMSSVDRPTVFLMRVIHMQCSQSFVQLLDFSVSLLWRIINFSRQHIVRKKMVSLTIQEYLQVLY